MKPVANSPWSRLVAAARQAPGAFAPAGDAAPPGFVTRVVALAANRAPVATAALFERFALRALWCAMAVMLASALWNLTPTATAASSDDRSADLLDPVGEVLQLVQNS